MKKLIAGGGFWEGETAGLVADIAKAGQVELAGKFADRMQVALENYLHQKAKGASATDVIAKLEKFTTNARQVQLIMREWASNAPAAEIARDAIGQGLQFDPGLQKMVAGTVEFRRLESTFRRLADAAKAAKRPENSKGREGNEAIGELLDQAHKIFVDAGGRPKLRPAFEKAIREAVGFAKEFGVDRIRDKHSNKKKTKALTKQNVAPVSREAKAVRNSRARPVKSSVVK